MKRIALLLALAGTLTAAQTPTTPAAKPATTAAKPAVTTKSGTATATVRKTGVASGIKLPPGVPPVKGLLKSAFALRYQEIQIGTGPVVEPLKVYKVKYTGWLAADGKKFDASDDHPNKEPIQFPQGRGRVIPGWDQGFEGMKIGGKRRLFIPYQLAYGTMGRPPVIPAKSDLIFDIELVGVADMPTPTMPNGRTMPPRPGAVPTPPTGATPSTPAAAPKPAETANPNPSTATPAPTTPPPADKPVNPEQPK